MEIKFDTSSTYFFQFEYAKNSSSRISRELLRIPFSFEKSKGINYGVNDTEKYGMIF
jgi:hypothetical protein